MCVKNKSHVSDLCNSVTGVVVLFIEVRKTERGPDRFLGVSVCFAGWLVVNVSSKIMN